MDIYRQAVGCGEGGSLVVKLMKYGSSICQNTDSELWVSDVHPQWIEYYQAAEIAKREEKNLVIQKHKGYSEKVKNSYSICASVTNRHYLRRFVNQETDVVLQLFFEWKRRCKFDIERDN